MPKYLLLVLISLFNFSSGFSQIIDIQYPQIERMHALAGTPPSVVDVLKNGNVNFLTDGSVQASANLLHINIGDPNHFYLPFYIYTGASGNAFGSGAVNQTTASNLLNPTGGTVNLSFNGLQNLFKTDKMTKLKFAYQIGARLTNGKDSATQANINFFSGLANAGLFFQTGAWNADDPNASNIGVFYVQAKITATFSSQSNLQQLFGQGVSNNSYLLGYTLDAGIEINQVINVKFGLYQFTNNSAVALLNKPVVQFAMNYSLKK